MESKEGIKKAVSSLSAVIITGNTKGCQLTVGWNDTDKGNKEGCQLTVSRNNNMELERLSAHCQYESYEGIRKAVSLLSFGIIKGY